MFVERGDRKELIRAREYIRAGKFDEARNILSAIVHNKTARSWLKKVDQLERDQKADKKLKAPSQDVFGVPKLALRIIIISMLIWIASVSIYTFNVRKNIGEALLVGIALLAMCSITMILQFVGWKLYWWMLALAWVLGTIFMFWAMASGLVMSLVP